ncbi:MAG TPA: phospholipase D-like domain-containing protein, partial [Gammaproteobacteria bacterium]
MNLQDAGNAPAMAQADRFVVFTDGDTLYDDMLEHIRNARKSVRLESYIFENDAVGNEFIEACSERARAGLKVQLHLDALGSLALSLSDAPDRLRDAGVELRWFNPARLLRLFKLNRRNHRKLLVVDEHVAWLGGFNIHVASSRRYFGKECWRDTQVRIEGQLATVAAEYFDHLWQGRRNWRIP